MKTIANTNLNEHPFDDMHIRDALDMTLIFAAVDQNISWSMVYATCSIALLSFLVWAHHMFTTGSGIPSFGLLYVPYTYNSLTTISP